MLAFPATGIPMRELRDLVRPVEPTVSVYLGAAGAGSAGLWLEVMLRRRRIAGHLAEQGAANVTIDAVLGYLARLPETTAEHAVFARDGRVVLATGLPGVADLPGPAAAGLAAYSAPAKVSPLLAWNQRLAPYAPWDRVDVSGAEATVEALACGRVRRLLIVDDPADRRTGWFGVGLMCATEHPAGRVTAQRGHLTDIVIRAAVLGRATVTVLAPEEAAGLAGGMGAVLTR